MLHGLRDMCWPQEAALLNQRASMQCFPARQGMPNRMSQLSGLCWASAGVAAGLQGSSQEGGQEGGRL